MTIAWQVYAIARQRHSVQEAAFALGMIGLAQFLPLFALSLFAGDAADRHDRKRINRDLHRDRDRLASACWRP